MNDETRPVQVDETEMPAYDPMSDLMQRLDEMESQENASFRVYRQHSGNTSKMSFLFTVPADQFSIEELLTKVRDEYGGGEFRIHLRGPTDAGNNQLIANRVFSVETPRQPEPQKQPETNPLTAVVEKMDARMERLEERLLERQSQPAQATDPMKLMESMIGMLGTLNGIMPNQGSNQTPQKSLVEQMQELRDLQELASEMGGEKGGGNEWTALIKDGLKPMMDLMQEESKHRKEARERGLPYHPSESQKKTQPRPDPSNGANEMNGLDEGTKAMLSNVKTLLSAAQRGGDPETYAEIVLDFVPEQKYVEMHNFLSMPDAMDTLAHHFPAAAQYRDWFDSLRGHILAQLDVSDDATDEPGTDDGHDARPGDLAGHAVGTGGDTGDAAGNGEDGEGREGAASGP